MSNKVNLLGVNFDPVTMQDAVERIFYFIEEEKFHMIFTPNAEIMMAAQRDPELKTILNRSDLLLADGAGVILSSKILGVKLPEKVSGVDVVKNLFMQTFNKSITIFILGSKPGIAEEAARNISRIYTGVKVVGTRNGYFKDYQEEEIIEQINSAKPDILLVGLGAPKQEKWIYKNRKNLKVKVAIGVGGTIDVLAGKAKLAPEFIRKAGFEWLYRLIKEPWRIKRMIDLPKFMIFSLKSRFLGYK